MHLLSASPRSVSSPMLRTASRKLLLEKTMISWEGYQWRTSSARYIGTQALKRKRVRRGGNRILPRTTLPTTTTTSYTARKPTPLHFSSQAVESNSTTTTTAAATAQSAMQSSTTTGLGNNGEQLLSWKAAKALFVASAVPMVGFGFMDNLVMIQAGQYIDSTLGVKLGLATMTAAACGQVVSDVSGVLFGGTLETFINRWMPNPVAATLSTAQRQSKLGRYASLAGAVIGVTVGCALGALTLFFVDLDARDRIQRARQFKEVLSDMTHISNTGVSFPCRKVIVHLAVEANQHYDWQSLNQDDDDDDADESTGTQGPHVFMRGLKLAKEENFDDLVVKAARQQNVLVSGQRLFAPIMRWEANKSNEVWAVVEFVKDGDEVSELDIAKVELMATHLAIFMHRMAD